jgi:hypothetical protein
MSALRKWLTPMLWLGLCFLVALSAWPLFFIF